MATTRSTFHLCSTFVKDSTRLGCDAVSLQFPSPSTVTAQQTRQNSSQQLNKPSAIVPIGWQAVTQQTF